MQFDVAIEKTTKGFGIYFARVAAPDDGGDILVVDGFVEGQLEDDQPVRKALAALQLGDILMKVNGESCQEKEVTVVLDLLRAAGIGTNTLSFLRNVPTDTTMGDGSGDDTVAASVGEAPTSRLMGALLKVKSKIRAEIDGDEKELLREQQEDERFERQWLEEFALLKIQYETKWETCTYTADEFCGLLYRSSDAQQKEYLLQEYPTLMEAWKEGRASSSSSRAIPGWPSAKVNYANGVEYSPVDCKPAKACSIECPWALQKTLECLRMEFMWRSDDLRAFSRRLDADGIASCSGLLEALNARSNYFERNFQSNEYPRLTKTMIRALRVNAQKGITKPSDSVTFLAMDRAPTSA